MPQEKLPTKYLPAEKASAVEVERHHKMLRLSPLVAEALDGMINFGLILNRQRQAVFINKALADYLEGHGITNPIGERPGSLFGCIHAAETPGGCGTTDACRRCGAALAIVEALAGKTAARECRILSRKSGEELDLRLRVQPFKYAGEDFLLMSIVDISSEKRREVLEKLFFHDILNTAGGVQALISLMLESESVEARTYMPAAAKASDRVVDQILSQRDLAAAERGDLQLRLSEVDAVELLNETAALLGTHDAARNKKIVLAADHEALRLTTDRALLSRVLVNMVKNALEAENAGSVITVSCRKAAGGVAFLVYNPAQMPDDSRLQVFQRSFTTKGTGRGLGTYSIRLLTEKYLKGKVSFSTGPGGTEFRAEYPGSL